MVRLQGVLFITLEREREREREREYPRACRLVNWLIFNIRVGTFEVYNELCMNLVSQSKSSIN
jgi:hypothetical protein